MSGPNCDIARDKGADPDSTIVDLRLTPDHNLCITDHWCRSVCGDTKCDCEGLYCNYWHISGSCFTKIKSEQRNVLPDCGAMSPTAH